MKSILNKNRLILLSAILVFTFQGIAGIHFGLPNKSHMLSYNPDEYTWLQALMLSSRKEEKFNPFPECMVPSGYMYVLGASLKVASLFNIVTVSSDKKYYVDHPDEWAKFYLVGRGIQIVFGVIGLLFLFLFVKENFGINAARIAVLLFSVTPSHVAATHFSQASLPVTAYCIIALWSIGRILNKNNPLPWVCTAGILTGLAIGTKYSAIPLLLPLGVSLFYANSRNRVSLFLAGALSVTTGLFIAVPYAFINFSSFYGAFLDLERDNTGTPFDDTGLFRLAMPLVWPLRYGMGSIAVLLALAAFAWSIAKRKSIDIVILSWIALFYACSVSVGRIASPERMLIAVPAIIALIARLLSDLSNLSKQFKVVSYALGTLVFLNAAYIDAAILGIRNSTPLQESSSEWILNNIQNNAVIAVPREPYCWSPVIIHSSYYHPERINNPYNIVVLDYDLDLLKKEKPEYIIAAYFEIYNHSLIPRYQPWGKKFREFILSQNEYTLIKHFPRITGKGVFQLNRPEKVFFTDDDLWTSSLYIYKRKSLDGDKS